MLPIGEIPNSVWICNIVLKYEMKFYKDKKIMESTHICKAKSKEKSQKIGRMVVRVVVVVRGGEENELKL